MAQFNKFQLSQILNKRGKNKNKFIQNIKKVNMILTQIFRETIRKVEGRVSNGSAFFIESFNR